MRRRIIPITSVAFDPNRSCAFTPESGLLVGEQSPEAAPVTCMKSNLTVQFLPLI
jgi:hypothetical protein